MMVTNWAVRERTTAVRLGVGCARLRGRLMANVLVIDKDALQLELLTFLLKQEGHQVHATSDPDIGFDILQSKSVNLLILEPALPRHDGEKLCWQIRQLRPDISFMILSERDKEDQIVRGLSCADDYVTKPFSPHQFLARVGALLRRVTTAARDDLRVNDERIAVGEITLNLHQMHATVNGDQVALTPREFSLLCALMDNPNRVLSRGQLMRLAWGDQYAGTPKTVDVCVLRLRKKLQPHLMFGNYIQTMRGFGYKLELPSELRAQPVGAAGYRLVTEVATSA